MSTSDAAAVVLADFQNRLRLAMSEVDHIARDKDADEVTVLRLLLASADAVIGSEELRRNLDRAYWNKWGVKRPRR